MDVAIQQLVVRFASTLNRRRRYSSNHPIVVAAEEQLLDTAVEVLRERSAITISIARRALLIDGTPWEMPTADSRELTARLQRRGVSAITLESGINLVELRDALSWLGEEPDGSSRIPANQSGVLIARPLYVPLVDEESIRDAQTAIAFFWRSLADVTGKQDERTGPDPFAELSSEYAGLPLIMEEAPAGATGFDTGAILDTLRGALDDSTVAQRTASALMELTSHGATTTDDARSLIGDQVRALLEKLGRASLASLVTSLVETNEQQRFVMQLVDMLPSADAMTWLEPAAQALDQNVSREMMAVLSKLATVPDATHDLVTDGMFRDAARDFVQSWTVADPDPAQHVELLARIAGCERVAPGQAAPRTGTRTASIESSRLVQMSLESDEVGADTMAAVDSLLSAGQVQSLLQWITTAGDTVAARALRAIATSEQVVRQLLLTEPVDRLEARALLEVLDVSAADTLIDILADAGSKGTRLLVRQRLAEFGEAITPQLLARLDEGPWYLTRNLLSLLHDTAAQRRGEGAAADAIVALLGHQQVQVRLEALRVLVGMGHERRTAALSRALRDDNERVVVVALQDLGDSASEHGQLPPAIVAQIMALVDTGAQSEPVRARAIRTLASTRSDVVRDWLIGIVSRKTTLMRRLALAEPTPPAGSALHVLTKLYANDPVAAKVMEVARSVRQDARWQVRDSSSSMERTT